MKVVNIQAAKTHLSRLVEDAVGGEEIILARAGKPCVRLVPCGGTTAPRVLGGWEGKVEIADDFDAEDATIAKLFEGRADKTSAPGKASAAKKSAAAKRKGSQRSTR